MITGTAVVDAVVEKNLPARVVFARGRDLSIAQRAPIRRSGKLRKRDRGKRRRRVEFCAQRFLFVHAPLLPVCPPRQKSCTAAIVATVGSARGRNLRGGALSDDGAGFGIAAWFT